MLLPMSTSPPQDDPSASTPPQVAGEPASLAAGSQPQIDVYVGGTLDGGQRSQRPAGTTTLIERKRRIGRPLVLFFITCFTTFCAGCYQWSPDWIGLERSRLFGGGTLAELIQQNWQDGLLFMVCVMSALMFHEMGHFLMTLKHRVHASYPHFIPFPMMITGTMGAVIGMDGPRMNRKSLFDIGIAGPLAGLVLIIPFVIIGILTSDAATGVARPFGNPLLVQLLIPVLRPELPAGQTLSVNAFYMAGWVGMLVTGLNMIPISQLDGGHVSYSVFGKNAKWVARGVVFCVIGAMVVTDSYDWVMMLVLVLFMGVDHPPTSDDAIDIGWSRRLLGIASLSIPIFCFTPVPLAL